MVVRVRNKTEQFQQINFIDGTAKNVEPRGYLEIDFDTIYKDELERIKKFFKVVDEMITVPDMPKRSIKIIKKSVDGNVSIKSLNNITEVTK